MLDAFVSPFYMVLILPVAHGVLHAFVKTHGQDLTLALVTSIAKQIASGLEYVHGRNVIHRDLHTGNILVFDTHTDGISSGLQGCISPSAIRLADFGLACMHPPPSGSSGLARQLSVTVVGGYNAAPEILFVAASTRVAHYTYALDVWAFACVVL